jgi:hypothetical protein
MATDIIAIASGNPINEKRAHVSVLPTGDTPNILLRPGPAECDEISEIEDKYSDRFPETIIVGG